MNAAAMNTPAYVSAAFPDEMHMTKPISWRTRPITIHGDRIRFLSARNATLTVRIDATMYGGTVSSCAVVASYPSSSIIVGMNKLTPYRGQT